MSASLVGSEMCIRDSFRLSRVARAGLIALTIPALGRVKAALSEYIQATQDAVIPIYGRTSVCWGPGGISPPR
eukprot:303097-Alexandrium_andersonii.AAC.1